MPSIGKGPPFPHFGCMQTCLARSLRTRVGMSHFIGWVCIGLAAALVAAIWPFRRGVLGFSVNAIVGVSGAVGAALLGVPLGIYASRRDPLALPVAALGALTLLVLAHLLWSRLRHTQRRAHR